MTKLRLFFNPAMGESNQNTTATEDNCGGRPFQVRRHCQAKTEQTTSPQR
jgi:hypothetical protein